MIVLRAHINKQPMSIFLFLFLLLEYHTHPEVLQYSVPFVLLRKVEINACGPIVLDAQLHFQCFRLYGKYWNRCM